MAFSGRTHFCRPAVARRHSTRRHTSTSSAGGAVTYSSSASYGSALSLVGVVTTALGTTAVGLGTLSWHAASVFYKVLAEVSVIKEKISSQDERHKQATRNTDLRLEKLDVKIDKLVAKTEAKLEKHIASPEGKFSSLEGKFSSLEGKLDRLTLALIVSTAITNIILFHKCHK